MGSGTITVTNNVFPPLIILLNLDTSNTRLVPLNGSNSMTATAGDTIKAFDQATYDPAHLDNGALVEETVIPDGCGWLWFFDVIDGGADSSIGISVTVECPDPSPPVGDCENAVACSECNAPFGDVSAPHLPPPTLVFWNTSQSATATCPSGLVGDPVTATVAENTISSAISQADANNQAYSLALQQATSKLVCGLAGQLDGLLFLMPPDGTFANPCDCHDPSDQVVTAEGDVGRTYSALLRIRGIVELKPYAHYGLSGTDLPGTKAFKCANTAQAIPAEGGHNDNEYAIVVSNPANVFLLNSSSGSVAPTQSVAVDYQVLIPIKTGATVTLKARAIDGKEWANVANTVANNAPPPIIPTEPYLGQFLQIDVLSVY